MSEISLFLAACLYANVAYQQFRAGNVPMALAFIGYTFSNLCFMGTMR